MTRKPPKVNYRCDNEHQCYRRKPPCWSCLGRDNPHEHEYQHNFCHALPFRGSFIEVTEQNVPNSENYCGDSDSHPHGGAYFTCGQLSRSCPNVAIQSSRHSVSSKLSE